MTLEEAIKRYTDNAEYERTHGNLQGYLDFKQLAELLKELKQWREFGRNNAQFINDCLIQNRIDELYSSEIKNDADILRINNEVLTLRTTNEFCKSFNERYERGMSDSE